MGNDTPITDSGATDGGPTPAEPPLVEQILAIVATETAIPRERLADSARIDELGIASIDLVQTIFALETRFDIEIPVVATEAGTEFATVGDLVSHVLATIAGKGTASASGRTG